MKLPGQRPLIVNGIFSYHVEWEKMRVGESFFIPTHDPSALVPQIYFYARRYGVKVTMREMLHNGYYGVMTWRVPDNYQGGNDALESSSDRAHGEGWD